MEYKFQFVCFKQYSVGEDLNLTAKLGFPTAEAYFHRTRTSIPTYYLTLIINFLRVIPFMIISVTV